MNLVHVLQAAKYGSGERATLAECDWNNDGVFNQLDIIAALRTGTYLQGPAALTMAQGNDTREATTDELPVTQVDELLAI